MFYFCVPMQAGREQLKAIAGAAYNSDQDFLNWVDSK